jgi:hypothetical protein
LTNVALFGWARILQHHYPPAAVLVVRLLSAVDLRFFLSPAASFIKSLKHPAETTINSPRVVATTPKMMADQVPAGATVVAGKQCSGGGVLFQACNMPIAGILDHVT